MNQKQMNRAEMLGITRAYLDNHTSTWSSIPIISALKGTLDDFILEISQHQEAQQAAQVFLGSNKAAIKKAVAEKADILNDTLVAYAAIEGNAVLENKADKTFTEIYRLRNQDFNTVVKETIVLLDENVAAMADYGVTEDQVTDLKTSYDDFLAVSNEPRLYKVSSSQASKALEDTFGQAHDLLTNKLDKVMKRFKNSNSNFYNGYLSARVIVDH